MASVTLLAVGGAVVIGAALWYLYPEATARWVRRLSAARRVVFGLLSAAVALFLIASGSPLLVLVGFIMLLFGVLWILVERPDRTIRSSLGGG